MNDPKYILNEVNKGIKMGMDSISNIAQKVEDTNMKDDLLFQYEKYNEILNQVNAELKNCGDFPKELNPMQKAMGWMSVEFNTLDDRSDSKIAQMMIQGTSMGIVNGVKLLNHNPETSPGIKTILNKFVESQQNNMEQLKKYL